MAMRKFRRDSWLGLFQPHIVDRGHDYYLYDEVKELVISDSVIEAVVSGTEDYQVFISIQRGIVMDMECNCPYAEGGRHCKHMAAVLFACEEHEEDGSSDEEDVDVIELVNRVDEKVVRPFLIEVLAEDERLLTRFKVRVQGEQESGGIAAYKRQIDGIVSRYMGHAMFINYHEAYGFVQEMSHYSQVETNRLIEFGRHMEAFELSNYIFMLLNGIKMDDSDGGIHELAEECYHVWETLQNVTDEKVKSKMYAWFVDHLDDSVSDYLEDFVVRILRNGFTEKGFIQAKLELCEARISGYMSIPKTWSTDYQLGKSVGWLLELRREDGCDMDQLREVCKEYWSLTEARKFFISLALENGDMDSAINTLLESKEMDNDYAGLVMEYDEKLKEIYRLKGDQQAYIKQLMHMVISSRPGDFKTFVELKGMYETAEWVEIRERIFQRLPKYAPVDLLFVEEKLYDRLMNYVTEWRGLDKLQQHRSALIKLYPKEVLEKYRTEVTKMAAYTGGRKHYRKLVGILREMRKLDGGVELVNEIAKEWRGCYGNRPAMMDELRGLRR